MKFFRRLLSLLLIVSVLEKSQSNVLWPCDVDTDCNLIISGATCALPLGYCQCPAGHTFNAGVTKCIKESLYGEQCEEGIQCSHMLTGAQCENGVCGCANTYTYVRGRCRQLVNLNEACRDEVDCFFGFNRESVECKEDKCQCAEGFYQRFTNVCRRNSLNGEKCIVNADCIEPEAQCVRDQSGVTTCTVTVGTQTLSTKNAAVQTTQSLEQSLSIESPNKIYKSSSFSKNSRNFKYNKLATSSVDSSVKEESTQFGELCSEEHKPCPAFKYSICRRGFCHCQDGFYEKDGICKAELGEMVEDEAFCGVDKPNRVYRNQRCVCENNQFYNANMRTCLKSSLGINTACTQQSQCSPYGAAHCRPESPKRCVCHDYANYNPDTELCELKDGLEEYCKDPKDCSVDNTLCSNGNSCVCKPNFIAQNGDCKPGLAADCETNDDCAFENAECKLEIVNEIETIQEKKCRCQDDFVATNNVCLEKAKSYNDTCTENEQCMPLLGDKATCIDEKCACDESLHFKNGNCNEKKELNEQCTKSGECFVSEEPETVECRNGVCQCQFDYKANQEQNRCLPRRDVKNSSNNPSPLKVITLVLIGSAVFLTGSALKDAYYP